MRKTTKGHGLAGAFASAALVAGVMLLLAGVLLLGYFGGREDAAATWAVALCALVYLAIAVGVIAALVQRWREVKRGEEDEARKY